ncbi:MAG: hypothetical protein B7Y43_02115 [Sphingomonas sp. 28-62-20]|uniref:hypothetical protein n=1 Tax=Sphingomonas sp. 28-62-20 TaxID=1970433 RepID=UPI000BCCEF2C|nr:MAG: hypothetical protein B7Y43_02115 [Sphingomonas sp. 28-62-20]
MAGARSRWLLALAAPAIAASAPQPSDDLAFPFHRQIGGHHISAEFPIPSAMDAVLARADQRLSTSAIAVPGLGSRIFLTNGGWRWRALAKASVSAFAISRPGSELVIVNRSDMVRDLAFNGRRIGGVRPLSQVIAHEMAHGLLRRHFGLAAAQAAPAWKVEGYCDFVAGGGSLSDAEAARLIAAGTDHPALPYYLGRKRVEAILARNGGSVDALFANDDPVIHEPKPQRPAT